MREKLSSIIEDREIGTSILRASLFIILTTLVFLTPTFELGPRLGVFLASFAIVIISLITSHNSEKRIDLLKEQNELLRSQKDSLEDLVTRSQAQSDILQDLESKVASDESNNTADETENEPTEEEYLKEES
ncbi:hypothetical protein [Halolamina rubra]|uniref:hypothetical protein n=1 Tax=Halolamina rubra TaxID=1380430 RepID=UPI0012ABBB1A|nr:hypothetical protein [Halolamina rubra]